MMYARKPLVVLALAALAPACGNLTPNSTNDDGTAADADAGSDETSDTPTGGQSGKVTIFQIQKGEVPEKTAVELSGVVVTSPIYYSKPKAGTTEQNAYFFISEPEGGAFSGILVYVYADVMLALKDGGNEPKPGDTLDLIAAYTEYFGSSQVTLSNAADLTITGTGAVPEPTTVKAADITTGGPKAEDFEGCLVEVAGAKVTAPVEMFGEFVVDGVLKVDDLFFLPSPGPKPPVDTTFTNLIGQLTFGFDEFKLAPRSCADFQGWDGCEDPVDPTGDPTGDPTTDGNPMATIYEVQMGMYPDKTYVDLSDVVVTSQFFTDSKANGGFFIAEQAGGQFSGIQVYVYADVAAELEMAGAVPKLGDTVSISGQYTEFYEYSEITLSKAENLMITGTAEVPAAELVAAATVATGSPDAEAYEGVLISVEDVTVTKPVEMYGEFTVTDGLIVDDLFFAPEPGPDPMVGDIYTSITGLLTYSFSAFKLAPRTADDLVKAP